MSIGDLHNISYAPDFITWTWDDPADSRRYRLRSCHGFLRWCVENERGKRTPGLHGAVIGFRHPAYDLYPDRRENRVDQPDVGQQYGEDGGPSIAPAILPVPPTTIPTTVPHTPNTTVIPTTQVTTAVPTTPPYTGPTGRVYISTIPQGVCHHPRRDSFKCRYPGHHDRPHWKTCSPP